MEAKLSLSNLEDEHPFFSKTWNSYSEFKQDLDKYQTDENILLSTVNSKLIKNNDLLKQQFHYEYCQIKCKHGTKQRSNKVDNSRPK